MRAKYALIGVSLSAGDDKKIVRIADLNDGSMSITNDAEAVVQDVVSKYGDTLIEYFDTDGRLDRLLHENGVFTGFAPGPWER